MDKIVSNPKTQFLKSNCTLCGVSIQKARTGRPREYCPECREFRKHYNAILNRLDKIAPRLTAKSAKVMRGDLFAIANALPVERYSTRGRNGKFR